MSACVGAGVGLAHGEHYVWGLGAGVHTDVGAGKHAGSCMLVSWQLPCSGQLGTAHLSPCAGCSNPTISAACLQPTALPLLFQLPQPLSCFYLSMAAASLMLLPQRGCSLCLLLHPFLYLFL